MRVGGSSAPTVASDVASASRLCAHARREHEASTCRISEDQLFYLQSRGIGFEEAVSMMVSGFCRDVFNQLPLEFAAEADKLLALKLEGSVG